MNTFRKYDLDVIFNDLECLSPEECSRILRIDPEDKSSLRQVVEQYVLPWFKRQPDSRQLEIKQSLRFFLTRREEQTLRDILHGVQESPLRVAANAVQFFELIWSVLAPGEDYAIDSIKDWNEQR